MLPVGNILAVSVTQDLLNLNALVPLDTSDLGGGIVHQGSSDLFWDAIPELAVRARGCPTLDHHEPHHLLLRKVALHVNNTNRKQASLAEECLVGSRVNVEGSVGIWSVE
jgi:hypothetical protein